MVVAVPAESITNEVPVLVNLPNSVPLSRRIILPPSASKFILVLESTVASPVVIISPVQQR